jgi:hypothetical protein
VVYKLHNNLLALQNMIAECNMSKTIQNHSSLNGDSLLTTTQWHKVLTFNINSLDPIELLRGGKARSCFLERNLCFDEISNTFRYIWLQQFTILYEESCLYCLSFFDHKIQSCMNISWTLIPSPIILNQHNCH